MFLITNWRQYMSATSKMINPNFFNRDGVDHIRVNPRADTELGRKLSMEWSERFEHPVLGTFDTLINFSKYVLLPDHPDQVRYGKNSRRIPFGKLTKDQINILSSGVAARLLQMPELVKSLCGNDLPLVSYHIDDNGFKKTVYFAPWFLEGIEIAKHIFEQEQPENSKETAKLVLEHFNYYDISIVELCKELFADPEAVGLSKVEESTIEETVTEEPLQKEVVAEESLQHISAEDLAYKDNGLPSLETWTDD